MADINPVFSYTNRDYESARAEGLSKIPTLSEGVWTDLNATDPGIIMLDYVHALVDMIEYYQDYQALETFLPTAKGREDLFRIAKQLSYRVKGATSAKAYVTFETDFLFDHLIKIPRHTRVKNKSGIEYLTMEDTYLPANTRSVDVLCQQGKLYTGNYTGTGVSVHTVIDGETQSNQKIQLSQKNVDMSSIVVKDNLDRVWTPTEYIIFSGPEDRVYQVDLNADDTVTLSFGDGERGIIPQSTDILSITYIVSDAENGRLGSNSIDKLIDHVYDNGTYIEFNVTNNKPSSGGYSAQDSESIRDLAPGAIKAQDRAVTVRDFESLAKLVPGVSEARCYDINNSSSLNTYEVLVLITPELSDSDTSILTKEVYDYLSKRMSPPTILRVRTPGSIEVDIELSIKKFDNVSDAMVKYQVTAVVEDYFRSREDSIGQDFYPTDLATKVSMIDSVKYVRSMTPTNTVTVGEFNRAILGNLSILIS